LVRQAASLSRAFATRHSTDNWQLSETTTSWQLVGHASERGSRKQLIADATLATVQGGNSFDVRLNRSFPLRSSAILRLKLNAPHQLHKTRVGAIAIPDGFDFEYDDKEITIIDRLPQSCERLLLLAQLRIE